MSRARILFIRNGSFSFTNDFLRAQLIKRFPDCEIVDHDIVQDTYRNLRFFVTNTLHSILEYGVIPVFFTKRRGFYFFRTKYFFEKACRRYFSRLDREGARFDLVVQTQGIFNGKYRDSPLLIYTDYSYQSPSFGGKPTPARVIQSEKNLFRSANAIAVAGEHLRQTLLHDYACPPEKVKTVHIGANSDDVYPPDNNDRFFSQQICFIGIDWIRKGGEELLLAFDLVLKRFPDARLVIVGCSPVVDHKQITVLGRLPRAEVPQLYRNSAVFCQPSRVEPLGVAVVEASTSGLPIVATRLGGFLDSVVDGTTGLLVPPRDPAALAEALCALIGDPARAERMGAAGRLHALDRFDWDKVGEKIEIMARDISRIGQPGGQHRTG